MDDAPVPQPMPQAPMPWIDDGNLNRWRYVIGSNQEDIEIELTQGQVAICQFVRFDDVQERKWCAHYEPTGGGRWYAWTTMQDTITGKKFTVGMHTHLFPNLAAPIDHINGDGLDNRKSNVRDGSGSINQRNMANVVGVTELEYGFQARWARVDGTSTSRFFAKSAYASDEDAHAAALACRKENATHALNELIVIQAMIPARPPVAREYAPRTKARAKIQIPVKGLNYVEPKNGGPRVSGSIMINGQQFEKQFTLSKYGNSLEAAVEAGTAWANRIRAENPVEKKEPKMKSKKQKTVDLDESE